MQNQLSTLILFTIVSLLVVNTGCLVPYIEPAADSVIRIDHMRNATRKTVTMGFKDASCTNESGVMRVLAIGYDDDEHTSKLRCFLFP